MINGQLPSSGRVGRTRASRSGEGTPDCVVRTEHDRRRKFGILPWRGGSRHKEAAGPALVSIRY